MPHFYALTDAINKDCVVRFDESECKFERYNAARNTWVSDLSFFGEYLYEDSMFYDFYCEITEDEVSGYLDRYKKRWSGYWGYAKTLKSSVYPKMPSPIQNMDFDAYCLWLTGQANNEQDRVIYGLSGLLRIKDWKGYSAKLGIPDLLVEFIDAYSLKTLDIFRATNKVVYDAKKRELELLLARTDLTKPDAVKQAYSKLLYTYTTDQIYANIVTGT